MGIILPHLEAPRRGESKIVIMAHGFMTACFKVRERSIQKVYPLSRPRTWSKVASSDTVLEENYPVFSGPHLFSGKF